MLIARLSDPHVGPDDVLHKDVVDSNTLLAAAISAHGGLPAVIGNW